MNKKTKLNDRARSAEIPVGEEERGDECPEEEPEAQPAGAYLHPHSWHTAPHGLGFGVWSDAGHSGKGIVQ